MESVYLAFQDTITNGLTALQSANPAATINIGGMIWVQGENDISDAAAAAYGANLTRLIGDIRATFAPDMPFVFSQISDNQTVFSNPSDPDYPQYLELRVQQANVAANVSGAKMINIDGAEFTLKSDNLHFDADGQQALGSAFATAVQAIPEPSSLALLMGAGGIALAGLLRRR